MRAKQLLSLLLALVLSLGLLSGAALGAEEITVQATVVLADGSFAAGKDGGPVVCVPVTVRADSPTLTDAFAALHEQYYADGAAGFATEQTQWGQSVTTFWGITSNTIGYYQNNASAFSPSDGVADGDRLRFFFYQDTANWSDLYAHFSADAAQAAPGEELTLTLLAASWDDQGNPTSAPLAGAALTVDGVPMEGAVTDQEGRAVLTFDQPGSYLVSAAAPQGSVIVPPVCLVTVGEAAPADPLPRMEALMAAIAAGYTENAGEWVVMDMAAYARLGLEGPKTSDAAKQTYIDAAIAAIQAEGAADTTFSKAILALSALGVDAGVLHPAYAAAPISAVDGLNAAEKSASAWAAPYALAAYSQADWADAEAGETALLAAALANQGEDGSWSEWGDSIQATANMVTGLAFYTDGNEHAAAAVDKAVAYLSAAQAEDGSYDAFGYGPDANTAAMVVTALAAAGVDPDADERFIKGGVSALDHLLSFAYADNTGFGYQSNEKGGSADALATEQAFRGLIAAYGVMTGGEAFNVYDFRGGETAPGYETVSGLPNKHDDVKKTAVTTPGATFPDVAGHPSQTAIEALAARGIVTGGDGGLYRADTTMTRCEFAAIVIRALGLEQQTTDFFPDVAETDWFAGYAGAAHAYGIVTGGDGSRFNPYGAITRQEAAVMVARAAKLTGMDTTREFAVILNVLSQFGDYTAIADWAREGMAFCYDAGLLDISDLNAEPLTPILRGDMAQMLYNLLGSAKLL